MLRNPEIQTELAALSPAVANLNILNVFEVPEGYFDQLAIQVMARIKSYHGEVEPAKELVLLAPGLSEMGKNMPFEVDPNYFEMLPTQIMLQLQNIRNASSEDELKSISPLLSSIGKKIPFKVPEGYFENLNMPEIKDQEEKTPAKLISLGRRTRWINFAAAAVVIGFIAISAWLVFRGPVDSSGFISSANIPEKISEISDSEMIKYLESQFIPLAVPAEEIPMAELQLSEAEELFGDLPDTELSKYLQENPIIQPEEPSAN